jgi:hypothetical protein
MKLPRRNFLLLAAGAATLPAVSRIARAQAYPARPVRIIVADCEGAPWVVCLHDLNRKDVRSEAERRRSRRPLSRDPYQRSLEL